MCAKIWCTKEGLQLESSVGNEDICSYWRQTRRKIGSSRSLCSIGFEDFTVAQWASQGWGNFGGSMVFPISQVLIEFLPGTPTTMSSKQTQLKYSRWFIKELLLLIILIMVYIIIIFWSETCLPTMAPVLFNFLKLFYKFGLP